ncbi:MAG: hypothetical protein HPY55_16165 [Firmicutes bacterium]|nr:hypothetical protein [Bacillota bacterium]
MPRLTCGKCPVSFPFDERRRWCGACRAYFPANAECKYPTVEHMFYAWGYYASLAQRLTEAIAMREAEERAVR